MNCFLFELLKLLDSLLMLSPKILRLRTERTVVLIVLIAERLRGIVNLRRQQIVKSTLWNARVRALNTRPSRR